MEKIAHLTAFRSGQYTCTAPLTAKRQSERFSLKLGFVKGINGHKFESMLVLLIPQIVHLITEKYHLDEIEATERLYQSDVYASLEQEDTKLWHLSPLTLFNMFDEEQKTGCFKMLHPPKHMFDINLLCR